MPGAIFVRPRTAKVIACGALALLGGVAAELVAVAAIQSLAALAGA
jgi:hypothetical protein